MEKGIQNTSNMQLFLNKTLILGTMKWKAIGGIYRLLGISKEAINKLSHKVDNITGLKKTINSNKIPTVGVTQGVELRIGDRKVRKHS
ncbi:hypothetical protein J1N35_005989 [Gossypium stocksii]|uniref:Uncharacterized protein n=1 Tax=Gossypium stocksii TaxID=47602 RepID=A0A9D3WF32_9ROSI|nr:hypothetical protein J1N35_005989 [Gossypium stocksii]